jgi:hypothetical protein
VLERDNWDDYSRETNYVAAIYGANRKLLHNSSIKILNADAFKTVLPEEFESLPDNFWVLPAF